jgi:hypothetical protein
MIRKTAVIFLGAIAGAGLTVLGTQPHRVFAGSSVNTVSASTYQQLNLFGDVV